jgi:uncharacterized SAM-binding protein YcdF (DUF218 family)
MSRSNSFRIALLIVVLGLCVAGVFAFRGLGRWLVREDALRRADVIVVLSGGMPWRAEEAGKIFEAGYAREVWVSRPENSAASLESMGIQYVGEEDYDREILIHGGVPAPSIRFFQRPLVDTQQEVEETAREMRAAGKTSAIIVTSRYHSRRVQALWRRLAGENLTAIVRGAPEDPFDADHWWRNTRDAYAVMREVMGLLNAWAGLPVRPREKRGGLASE